MGTIRVLELCLSMPNLKSFVHVSTAFCNAFRSNINEEVYSTTPLDKDSFVNCVKAIPEDSIHLFADRLQVKLIKFFFYLKLF